MSCVSLTINEVLAFVDFIGIVFEFDRARCVKNYMNGSIAVISICNGTTIILIKAKENTRHDDNHRQLVLAVEDMANIKTRALKNGIPITEEYTSDKNGYLCVIAAPEGIDLVLVQASPPRNEDDARAAIENNYSEFSSHALIYAEWMTDKLYQWQHSSRTHGISHNECCSDAETVSWKLYRDSMSESDSIASESVLFELGGQALGSNTSSSVTVGPKGEAGAEAEAGAGAELYPESSGNEATTPTRIDSPEGPWQPSVGPDIPAVRAELLCDGHFLPITANTPEPISFCNEYFEGCLLFMVNSSVAEVHEPYTTKFLKDTGKNRFEVQVQGKFKKVPRGQMFLGAEITQKMELGILTKSVCSSILQLLRSYNPYVHHSFGDAHSTERPHITSPFWSTADRLIITPPGETPPPLVQTFPEDSAVKKARKGNPGYTVEVDLDCTYSFSLKTSRMDLEDWAVVNIPFMRSMDLHTFWANADLRFVAYFIPDDAPNIIRDSNGLPKKHPIKSLEYLFAMELRHSTNHPGWGTFEQHVRGRTRSGKSVSRPIDCISGGTSVDTSRSPVGAGTPPSSLFIPGQYESIVDETETRSSQPRKRSGDAGGDSAFESDDDDDFEFYDAQEGEGAAAYFRDSLVELASASSTATTAAAATAAVSAATGSDGKESASGSSRVQQAESRTTPTTASKRPSGSSAFLTLRSLSLSRTSHQPWDSSSSSCRGAAAAATTTTAAAAAEAASSKFTLNPFSRRRSGTAAAASSGHGPTPQSSRRATATAGDDDSQAAGDVDLAANASLVLAAIDLDDPRAGLKSRCTMYLFRMSTTDCVGCSSSASVASGAGRGEAPSDGASRKHLQQRSSHTSSSHTSSGSSQVVLHTRSEWMSAALPLSKKLPCPPCNFPRLSETERRRLLLEYSMRDMLRGTAQGGYESFEGRAKLEKFFADSKHTDRFLVGSGSGVGNNTSSNSSSGGGGSGVSARSLRAALPTFRRESLVCRQVGNHTWSEECLGLTESELVFIGKSARSRNADRLRVPLQDVLSVKAVPEKDNPLPVPGCHCLVVSTVAKQYVFIMRGLVNRDAWAAMLGSLRSEIEYLAMRETFRGSNFDRLRQISYAPALNDTRSFTSSALGGIAGGTSQTTGRSGLVGGVVEGVVGSMVGGVAGVSSGRSSAASVLSIIATPSAINMLNDERKGKGGSFSSSGAVLGAATPGATAAGSGVASSGGGGAQFLSTAAADILTYSRDWILGDKVILNGRSFTQCGCGHILNSCSTHPAAAPAPAVPATSSGSYENNRVGTVGTGESASILPHLLVLAQFDPCALVAQLLNMAFRLSDFENSDAADCILLGLDRRESSGSDHRDDASEQEGQEEELELEGRPYPTKAGRSTAAAVAAEAQQLWIDFMDGVSLLQGIDLALLDFDLESAEALCMFLNLYHCMLIHAFLIMGLPSSMYKWSTFFRNCSYEAFGDIFSLAELEHCVIRNAMSRPAINFLAQLLIPNLQFSFALKVRDYRLLWGVSCGSISNLSHIPIYTPHELESQLEFVMRASLEQEMRIRNIASGSLVLPVVCQWYQREFEYDLNGERTVPAGGSLSTKLLLKVLIQHLSGDLREAVARMLERKKQTYSVKYSYLDFACRFPSKLDTSTIEEADADLLVLV